MVLDEEPSIYYHTLKLFRRFPTLNFSIQTERAKKKKRKRHHRCISQKRYEKLSKYHGNETKHVVNTLTIFYCYTLYLVVLIFDSLSTLFSILFACIFSSVALIVFPRNFFPVSEAWHVTLFSKDLLNNYMQYLFIMIVVLCLLHANSLLW